MILKGHTSFLLALGTIIFTYLLFFYPLLNPNTVIFSGNDSTKLHYPSRIYLHEKLSNGTYPFWTERIFLGFPIYEDIERGFMNVVNLALVFIFGPYSSFKILHFICYLAGSVGLFLLFRKHSFSFPAFVTGNIIYFFNFFMLFHQQHFNLVLIACFLPLELYLMEIYLSTDRRKFLTLVLNGFLTAFCFYLGYMQFVFLLVLAGLVYSLIFHVSGKSDLINLVKYYLRYGILVLILVLPAILATSDLYLSSSRAEKFNPYEGSFFPLMNVNLVYPFMFNREPTYQGHQISGDFNIQETYIYFGVSTFIFSLMGFLMLKNEKLKKFILFLIVFFILTACAKYLPIIKIISLPPFSLFRYWVRSVIFVNLAAALLVGYFITNLKSYHIAKHSFVPVSILLLILAGSQLVQPAVAFIPILGKFLIQNNTEYHSFNTPWLIMTFTSFALVVWCLTKYKNFKILPYLVAALVVSDLLLFGSEVTSVDTFMDKNLFYRPKTCSAYTETTDFENQRVIDTTGCVEADNALTYRQWGILGISTFTQPAYLEQINSLGLARRSVIKTDSGIDVRSKSFENSLRNYGINYLVYGQNDILNLNAAIVKNEGITISNLAQKEGLYNFEINTKQPAEIQTFIRNHSDWKVYINGIKVPKTSYNNGFFLSFNAPAGKSQVEIKFLPVRFIAGLLISSLSLLTYLAVYRSSKYTGL